MFFHKIEEEIELEDFSPEELRKKLKKMKGNRASKKSILFSLLKTIPFFNKLMESVELSGDALTNIAEIEGHVSHASEVAGTGFHAIKLITSISDFLYIPAVYLGAFITNQDVPFSLSRNARFLYSAVILGLTITAFAFPPAAPIIALVTSLSVLGLSVITLANLFYKRYALIDQLALLENSIILGTSNANESIDHLEELHFKLKKLKKDVNLEEYKALEEEVKNARKEVRVKLKALQEMLDSREECQQQLEKLGTKAVLDRTIGTLFACLTVIGAAVSIFLPPVGLFIIAASASLAIAYVIGRVAIPFFKSLKKNKIYETSKLDEDDSEGEGKKDELTETETETEFVTSDMRVIHDRDKIMKAAKRLEKLVADDPIIKTKLMNTEPEQDCPPEASDTAQKVLDEPVVQGDEHPTLQ